MIDLHLEIDDRENETLLRSAEFESLETSADVYARANEITEALRLAMRDQGLTGPELGTRALECATDGGHSSSGAGHMTATRST